MIVLAVHHSRIACDIYHISKGDKIIRVDRQQTIAVLNKLLKSNVKIHGSVSSVPVPNKDANLYIAPADEYGMRKAEALYSKCMAYKETEEEISDPIQPALF